jgi:non-heme chloroperoxidase
MDTYADDLASLFNALAIKDAMRVSYSTGGGKVALHRLPRQRTR